MGYPSKDGPCPTHSGIKEALDDHEERLRQKATRLTILELEVRTMKENADRMDAAVEKMAEAVADLKVWTVKVSAVWVTISGIVTFILSHWDKIRPAAGQ